MFGAGVCRITHLLGSCKPLRLSEKVGKGHEEDQGHIGEEEDQIPEAWKRGNSMG